MTTVTKNAPADTATAHMMQAARIAGRKAKTGAGKALQTVGSAMQRTGDRLAIPSGAVLTTPKPTV